MRFSKKHERLNHRSEVPFGYLKYEWLSDEDTCTYEISSEFGLHGKDFMKVKEHLKRT